MPVIFRLRCLTGLLLLAATPFAAAESPMPEPIAPAVIGRPLEQIRPSQPVRPKPVAVKPKPPKQQAAARSRPAAAKPPVVAAAARPVQEAAAPRQAAAVPQAASVQQAAVVPQAAAAPPAAAVQPPSAPPAQPAPEAQRVAKQAADDRADPNAAAANDVGQGTRFARKPLAPGAYLNSKYQALVRKYYAAQPKSGGSGKWQIGEPVPARAKLTGVPDQLRAALPKVPPGHQYVQLDGEVLLVAVPSRMVVDGIPRSER